MDPTDRVVLSMSAPFVPLLGQCLRLSGAVDVVTLATRCLCTLLTWGIHVEASFVQAVGTHRNAPYWCYSQCIVMLYIVERIDDNTLFNPSILTPSLLILISFPHTLSLSTSIYSPLFFLPILVLALGGRLLRLMLRSGALRSTDSELVQACIRGLTALFSLHNNRLAQRADNRAFNKEKRVMMEINELLPDGKSCE